jgi:hypothetical protein
MACLLIKNYDAAHTSSCDSLGWIARTTSSCRFRATPPNSRIYNFPPLFPAAGVESTSDVYNFMNPRLLPRTARVDTRRCQTLLGAECQRRLWPKALPDTHALIIYETDVSLLGLSVDQPIMRHIHHCVTLLTGAHYFASLAITAVTNLQFPSLPRH